MNLVFSVRIDYSFNGLSVECIMDRGRRKERYAIAVQWDLNKEARWNNRDIEGIGEPDWLPIDMSVGGLRCFNVELFESYGCDERATVNRLIKEHSYEIECFCFGEWVYDNEV